MTSIFLLLFCVAKQATTHALEHVQELALDDADDDKENRDDLLVDWQTAMQYKPSTPTTTTTMPIAMQQQQQMMLAQQQGFVFEQRQKPVQQSQQLPPKVLPASHLVAKLKGQNQPVPKKRQQSNICVAVRKRPLSKNEKEKQETDVLEPSSDYTVKVHEPKYA